MLYWFPPESWAFYVNVPIEALSIVIVYFFLPHSGMAKDGVKEKFMKIDYAGVVLLVLTIVCLLVSNLLSNVAS